MTQRCTDKKCKSYGKEYVDRGYGYPVCPSTPQKLNNKFVGGQPVMMFLSAEHKEPKSGEFRTSRSI